MEKARSLQPRGELSTPHETYSPQIGVVATCLGPGSGELWARVSLFPHLPLPGCSCYGQQSTDYGPCKAQAPESTPLCTCVWHSVLTASPHTCVHNIAVCIVTDLGVKWLGL